MCYRPRTGTVFIETLQKKKKKKKIKEKKLRCCNAYDLFIKISPKHQYRTKW